MRDVSIMMRSRESRKGQLHRIKMRNTDTFESEKCIEPLTEATVYPDTIWRERERNGEIKIKGRKTGTERERKERKDKRERKNILHPSKYILQTTKQCSLATIRGQTLSQDHPFPPSIPSSIPPSPSNTEAPQKARAEGYSHQIPCCQIHVNNLHNEFSVCI